MSIIEEAVEKFKNIAIKESLINEIVDIKADIPSAANGKEVLVSASFKGSIGEAFTDRPSGFYGSVEEILNLELNSSKNRALVVSTINAVLRYLDMVSTTIHCDALGSKECANEMSYRFFSRWGEHLTVGLIGFQEDIANSLIGQISKGNVQISDLDEDNIGKEFEGVMILDGSKFTKKVVENNFLALVTGSSVINGTIDEILKTHKENNKNRIVIFYGTTIAGIDKLMNLRRLCLKSH